MYEAIHGAWCGSRTWATKCLRCGDPVFFFSCNCGCKVFFDSLGPPWPIHDCDTSWTRNLKRTTDESGKITVDISEGVTISRVPESFGIDKILINQTHRTKKAQKEIPIVAVKPENESPQTIVGFLREINHDISVFKKYGIEETKMGRAMLGSLGKEKIGRITVHVPPSVTKKQIESYTLWIPCVLIQDSRIIRGLVVDLVLEKINIHGQGYVWYSNEFKVVG